MVRTLEGSESEPLLAVSFTPSAQVIVLQKHR